MKTGTQKPNLSMRFSSRLLLWGSMTLFLGGMLFLIYSQVDNSLTDEDLEYIQYYLRDGQVPPLSVKRTYGDEIRFISDVQKTVQKITALSGTLPHGSSREPKDVYLGEKGYCYDRSRVIEKILRSQGFKARHLSIYATHETGSRLKSLFSSGVKSHAVSEVLTMKRWLVVDSNKPWLSINMQRDPVSINDVQSDAEEQTIIWDGGLSSRMDEIYQQPFTYVYGLYSRHGKFFPPYNFVPDIHWLEFMQNFL